MRLLVNEKLRMYMKLKGNLKFFLFTLCFFVLISAVGNEAYAQSYCKSTNICSYKTIIKTGKCNVKKNKRWNPKTVAQKTNCRLRKLGYTQLPVFLRKQLKKKSITKQVYKRYYPNAGASYIKVYIRCNLYSNRVEGECFKYTKDVVDYLVNIYEELPECSFYNVVYKKKIKKNREYYYMFYLYNGFGRKD